MNLLINLNERIYIYISIERKKNNHNACITNFEKEHYKQDRVNLENDEMMMNCMNCSNADLKMIASDVDLSQENRDIRSKHSCNNKEKVFYFIFFILT